LNHYKEQYFQACVEAVFEVFEISGTRKQVCFPLRDVFNPLKSLRVRL